MCPARNATQNPIPYERTRYVYNTRQAFKSLYSQLAKTGNCCLGSRTLPLYSSVFNLGVRTTISGSKFRGDWFGKTSPSRTSTLGISMIL